MPSDLSIEVSAQLASDIAKRKAELLTPTLTRNMDLGDLGEHTVTIEYDAGSDSDASGPYSWFHVTSLKLGGVDLWPGLDKETQLTYETELSEAVEDEARESEE